MKDKCNYCYLNLMQNHCSSSQDRNKFIFLETIVLAVKISSIAAKNLSSLLANLIPLPEKRHLPLKLHLWK